VNNQYLKMKNQWGQKADKLLTASVTRGHSDHEKLLLSDETVRAANKGIYMFVIK
jgi:hypothetical protein